MIEKTLEEFSSSSLKTLQENLFESLNLFTCNDSFPSRPNNLQTSFHFNPLNGEFNDGLSNTTNFENKIFSMESKHHEVGSKENNLQYTKSNKLDKDVVLEGSSRTVSNADIDNQLKKWSEVLLQTVEEDNLGNFDEPNLESFLDCAQLTLDTLNLTTYTQDESQNNGNNELQYNYYWNSLSKYVINLTLAF